MINSWSGDNALKKKEQHLWLFSASITVFTDVLMNFASFRTEHPGPQSQGEDSCSDHVHSQQEEGKETLEKKPWQDLWCKLYHTHTHTQLGFTAWFSQYFFLLLHSFPLSSCLSLSRLFVSVLCEVREQLRRYQTHYTEWTRSSTRSIEVRMNYLFFVFFLEVLFDNDL